MIKIYSSQALEGDARCLAAQNNFSFAGVVTDPASAQEQFILFLDEDGLSLRQTGKRAPGPVRCDFVGGSANHRRLYGGGKSQQIAKAVGIRDKIRPRIADLTAGMGGDSFVFASLGCEVVMVERNPVVAALLADGLERARLAAAEDEALAVVIARLTLSRQSAEQWLRTVSDEPRPEVIYLDPMFPERKKSAQVNKSMQAFKYLVGSDDDADQLLPLALSKAIHRVVVKRPAHAPWLNGEKPGFALEGKSVRFDIYPLKALGS